MPGKKETILHHFLEEIRTGRLKAGDRLPSRQEMMGRFKCARATADQAVETLMAKGILQGERGGGTYVADRRPKKRGDFVSLVAPSLDPSAMPHEIIHGFMRSMGSSSAVRLFTYLEIREPKAWDECRSGKAVVFVMPDAEHASFLIDARAAQVPHLLAYRDFPESPFVSIDNRAGAAALVDHLAGRGIKRIGYLGQIEGRYHFPEQRYAGFLEGLLRNGLTLNKAWTAFGPEGREGEAVEKLFSAPELPQAVISAFVPLGLILSACEKRGLKPGRDILLASFGPVARDSYPFEVPSLASVTEEVGRAAAASLSQLLDKPNALIQIYVTPEIESAEKP